MTDETKPEKEETQVQHKSVFEAVAACVPEVRTIGKSDRNKFDGYDFASIDKFLALVGPICGHHQLFPFINLVNTELYENQNSKGGKSMWCRFWYAVTLYHSSGQSLPETSVMVSVPMNGAQSSGSAQSYALKQYFRSLLMIPTGDKDDADLIPTEAHKAITETPKTASWEQTIVQELSDDATPRDKAFAIATALCDQFKRMKGERQLGNEWDRREHLVKSLEAKHPDLHETVIDAYENRMNEIKEAGSDGA